MQGQALVDYVKRVMDLEVDIYENERIYTSFMKREPQKPQFVAYAGIARPEEPKLKKEDTDNICLTVGIGLCLIGLVSPGLIKFVCLLFGIPFSLMGFLFHSASSGTNEDNENRYKQEMEEYRRKCQAYEADKKRAERENTQRRYDYGNKVAEYNKRKEAYNGNLSSLGNASYELKNALDTMYSLNVIYPKYRNLVAVSTIYEYLSSGRCDRLDGPNGAYNLYEMELRQNIIIGQLSSIVENLNQIRNNQFTLYNELVSANQRAASVLSDIGNNVKISAYQNEAAAKNAEALKYISLIKH